MIMHLWDINDFVSKIHHYISNLTLLCLKELLYFSNETILAYPSSYNSSYVICDKEASLWHSVQVLCFYG